MELKTGDKIRIVAVPGEGDPAYYIAKETARTYKKIIARRRPVRIANVDPDGIAWYTVRFRRKDGTWEWHWLSVYPEDTNWVPVKPRIQ